MRIHVGRASRRLVMIGSALAGAAVATRGVRPDAVDATTRAACVSHLPATGVRCSTDHAAAQLVPYFAPALGGIAMGLLLAVVVLGALREFGHARRPAVASVTETPAPSWLVVRPAESAGHAPDPRDPHVAKTNASSWVSSSSYLSRD